MATFPTGVAVVTTTDAAGAPRGMTCSSVCSVSLFPPMLSICLRQGSPTLASVLWRRTFAVNLLRHTARATAVLFASAVPDRFDRVRWEHEPGAAGPHLIDDAHGIADCRTAEAVPIADHIVLFGAVTAIRHTCSTMIPLLRGMHRYSSWTTAEEDT
ncbi:flavin reductase family protein [Mangrovihabitans endophyticus]|nr:flavin reductase family protein [Mangrovihabitans endophyticus]